MPAPPTPTRRLARAALALTVAGTATLAYARLYEVNAFRLRRVAVPVLPVGARPIRVLHLSDLHLTPSARRRQRWLTELSGLEPDLVVDTGDNLAHQRAVPYVLRSLGRLLDRPGVYVWGSNDYYAPTFKNPLRYLTERRRPGERHPTAELPWPDLGEGLARRGWTDLTHTTTVIEVEGVRIEFRGVDDAHLGRDHYAEIAGPVDRAQVHVAIGVTHAPYRRVLDAMTADGLDLILAGHTHGGQVCLPGFGALVTNCDLDPGRVQGLSRHRAGGRTSWLHVSAGVGTSPYAPVRFACPPEATLLTLTPGDADDASPAVPMG